jgi:hypothetical protein
VGLRGIFDDDQAMAPRHLQNRVHVRRLPVQVDRLRKNRKPAGRRNGLPHL